MNPDPASALFGSPWLQHLIIDRDGTVVLRESGGSAARGAELGRVIQALLDRS